MDFINICLSLASFGTLSYSIKQQLNINATDRKLKQFIKTKTFSPKDLIKGMKEKEAYLFNHFKEYGKNEISGKLFVEGLPYSDRPIPSLVTQEKLLHSIFFKEDIFSNDSIHAYKKFQKKFAHPKDARKEKLLSFNLRDYKGGSQCLILNNSNEEPNYDAALQLIGVKEIMRPLNFFEKILVFLLMFFDFLNTFDGGSGFTGIKIGIREKEIGIKIDSFLTIFGEVIYNFEKKSLRIENPEYFLKNKTNLLDSLREYIHECKTERLVCSIIGLTCLGILGYRLYRKYKRRNAIENRANNY